MESKFDNMRSLEILQELSANESITQRDLSKRLGIALGLVNSYIKNLITKGCIKVTSLPPKKYVYLLTPNGFAEKSRLTIHLLNDYTRLYRQARETLKAMFAEIAQQGGQRIVFAGTDEIAEIAYISLQEAGLELHLAVDTVKVGLTFFGKPIYSIDSIANLQCDLVIITSYHRREDIMRALRDSGVPASRIRETFTL